MRALIPWLRKIRNTTIDSRWNTENDIFSYQEARVIKFKISTVCTVHYNLNLFPMPLLYTWIALIIGFLIIEVLTATFYGLSLALSGTIVALYVYSTWAVDMDITQGIIFALASLLFAFILPKYLKSSFPDTTQWADSYIGQIRTVKKVGGDLKISLDGVDYLIESDTEISIWDKAKIIGHHWVSMRVEKL